MAMYWLTSCLPKRRSEKDNTSWDDLRIATLAQQVDSLQDTAEQGQ
jgi:hypothetical protein